MQRRHWRNVEGRRIQGSPGRGAGGLGMPLSSMPCLPRERPAPATAAAPQADGPLHPHEPQKPPGEAGLSAVAQCKGVGLKRCRSWHRPCGITAPGDVSKYAHQFSSQGATCCVYNRAAANSKTLHLELFFFFSC